MSGEQAPLLLVGPSWVGDMVLAQALLQVLRARQPTRPIDVLAPPWSHPLLARMPEVRRALSLPVGHGVLGLGVRYRLGQALRPEGYGQAILLPNSLKSALVPFWARIPRRTGFLGELRFGLVNDVRPLDRHRLPRTVDRFIALGLEPGEALPASLPFPALRADAESAARCLSSLGIENSPAPLLVLCPGAEYGPAKQWPVEHFAALACHHLDRGWRVWIIGSGKEQPLAAAIVAAAGGRGMVNLAGKTSLAEAVDLLAQARVVVSNDSGLMHVAAALDVPLLALFGSSDPAHTPPLGRRVGVLSLGLACSPCMRRRCPRGHLDCLRRMTPEMVIEALDGVLPEGVIAAAHACGAV